MPGVARASLRVAEKVYALRQLVRSGGRDEPLTGKQVIDIFGDFIEGEKPPAVTAEEVLGFIGELNSDYERSGRSVRIVKVAGGYQFATKPEFAV